VINLNYDMKKCLSVSPSLSPLESFFDTPIGQHGKHISPKDLKHSWSKYDRENSIGLQARTPEWACQICGKMQNEMFEPWVFPISDREYLRICDKCENKRIQYDVHTFEILIMICRVDN